MSVVHTDSNKYFQDVIDVGKEIINRCIDIIFHRHHVVTTCNNTNQQEITNDVLIQIL